MSYSINVGKGSFLLKFYLLYKILANFSWAAQKKIGPDLRIYSIACSSADLFITKSFLRCR